MFAHRPEDQQESNPFLTTPSKASSSQREQQFRLAAPEPLWLEGGYRGDRAAISKSTPEVARHRAALLSHWGETPAHVAGSNPAAQDMASQAARPADPFERLTRGDAGEYVSESHAPARLTLPAEMRAGLADAWRKSRPQGRALEQGGVMVRNPDGSTAWLPGGSSSEGEFDPNWRGVKHEQTVLATGHTHPYDDLEKDHINVPFSGRDLAAHAREAHRLSVVRSGPGLFASARTREFEEYIQMRGDAARWDIEEEIKKYWDALYDCTPGDTRQRAEVATRATSAHYHLLYYAGQHGKLKKVDLSAEPQHQECFVNASAAQNSPK